MLVNSHFQGGFARSSPTGHAETKSSQTDFFAKERLDLGKPLSLSLPPSDYETYRQEKRMACPS